MDELTVDALRVLAEALDRPLDRDRLEVILPEVRRLLEASAGLRELPIDPAVSPWDPA